MNQLRITRRTAEIILEIVATECRRQATELDTARETIERHGEAMSQLHQQDALLIAQNDAYKQQIAELQAKIGERTDNQ